LRKKIIQLLLHLLNHTVLGLKIGTLRRAKKGTTYIRIGPKAAALTCGLPLAIAVVLPGCLPQKEVPQTNATSAAQQANALQVKETGLETVFDQSMHLPGELVVNLQGGTLTQAQVVSLLQKA
jgi:hypothetical protein